MRLIGPVIELAGLEYLLGVGFPFGIGLVIQHCHTVKPSNNAKNAFSLIRNPYTYVMISF
jgi:hypothetical protein